MRKPRRVCDFNLFSIRLSTLDRGRFLRGGTFRRVDQFVRAFLARQTDNVFLFLYLFERHIRGFVSGREHACESYESPRRSRGAASAIARAGSARNIALRNRHGYLCRSGFARYINRDGAHSALFFSRGPKRLCANATSATARRWCALYFPLSIFSMLITRSRTRGM